MKFQGSNKKFGGKFGDKGRAGSSRFARKPDRKGSFHKSDDTAPSRKADAYRGRDRDNKRNEHSDAFRGGENYGRKNHDAPRHRKQGPQQHSGKKEFFKSDKPKSASPKSAPRFETHKPREIYTPKDGVLIWGLHAARAAWLNPKRRCFRLWMTDAGSATFAGTLLEAKDNLLKRPDNKIVDRAELDRLTPPGSVHQGIVLEVAPLHEPTLHDIIAGDNPPDLLLMLDQVTDPHNVGAIVRSAAAFGAGAVIMTERNAPTMTGVQAKAASGAAEHVPQIHVVNLARALDELQQAGYWCVGLAEEGAKDLSALDLTGRTVLVMGNEGEGLRQLTRKKCDELAHLPTGGAIGSLNVSNAAAVSLYEVRRQKK